MENIPNEVLEIIFFQLSHRYLATCSKVCRKWNKIIRSPQYYHSIEIYTIKQLNKFILFAQNIKVIPQSFISSSSSSLSSLSSQQSNNNSNNNNNNESLTVVGEYVYHLKLHPHYLSQGIIIELLTVLPNIQSIHYFYFFNEFKNQECLPPLKKLTHITRWFTKMNKNWMNDYLNKDQHITSLEFDVDDEIYQFQQSNQFIRLQPIGGPIQHRIHFDDDNHHHEENDIASNQHFNNNDDGDYILHQGKVLILPNNVLNHLTTLKLDFTELSMEESGSYDIDERTLESIYQSCPLLESLSVEGFDMNICGLTQSSSSSSLSSTEYNHYQQTTAIQPAHQLKNLKFHGAMHDPHCFYYLSAKYPQLETLELFLEWGQLSIEKNEPYKQAISYFITHFSQLKKLDITLHIYSSFGDIVLIEDGYWPNDEFMEWLHHSPNQLTYLKYPFDLPTLEEETINHSIIHPLLPPTPPPPSQSPPPLPSSLSSSSSILIYPDQQQQHQMENEMIKKKTILNNNNNNEIDNITQLYHQRRSYLNHLASLSLVIKNSMIDETINYLLCNKTKSVASFSIKELNISYDSLVNNKEIQIYEWLNIFPNLIRFFINTTKLIRDGNDDDDDDDDDDQKSTTTATNNNITEDSHNVSFYPLQEIHISNAILFFKNGFTKFCQKCPHLKTITLCYITYSLPFWYSSMNVKDANNNDHSHKYNGDNEDGFKKVIFDLSHLKLDLFYINGLCYGPWDNVQHGRKYKINTLFVEELDSHHSYMVHEKKSELEDIQFCLFSHSTFSTTSSSSSSSTTTNTNTNTNTNDNINFRNLFHLHDPRHHHHHHQYSNITSLHLKCRYVDGLVLKR